MQKENVQVEVAQSVPQNEIEHISVPEFDRASQAAAAYLSPRQIFSEAGLAELNQRSNWKGSLQLLGHLGIMGLSGYLWLTHVEAFWIGIPSLMIYGFSFASMFAAMHECVHRTAFANNRTNDLVAIVLKVKEREKIYRLQNVHDKMTVPDVRLNQDEIGLQARLSRGLPSLIIANHGIENHKKFPHTGHQSNLLQFSFLQ